MEYRKLFRRFNPHETVEIDTVDHTRGRLSYRCISDGTRCTAHFGISTVRSALQEGRLLDVQFGRVSKADADWSDRRRAGDHMISAIRHPLPTLTPLSLGVLRWSLGDDECLHQLALFTERANSNQSDVEYSHGDDLSVRLDLVCGSIKAEADLGQGARTSVQGVHLAHELPDTVMAAVAGRRIGDVIDHPALRDAGTIVHANPNDRGGTYIHLAPATITATDAMAIIRNTHHAT